MSTTPTAHYAWAKPVPGTEVDTWGPILNTIFDQIDAKVFSIDLGSVTITTPAIGEHLRYNGTKWVNGVGYNDQSTTPKLFLTDTALTLEKGAGTNTLLQIRGNDSTYRRISAQTGASGTRWILNLADNTPEGAAGANIGSHFRLDRYSDVATPLLIDSPIQVDRTLGVVNLNATRVFGNFNVDRSAAGANTIISIAADPGFVKRLASYSGAVNSANTRWILDLGDNTAETGSDAGTNLGLWKCTDGGVPTSILTINRATGLADWNTIQHRIRLTSAGLLTIPLALQNASATAGSEVAIDFAPNNNGIGARSAQIAAININASATALAFRTATGTGPTTRMTLSEVGGLFSVGATGGDKGLNTLNFNTLYENGTSLAAKYAPQAAPTFTGLITIAGQIAFPAVQVPSAGANILDDYEEGTFVPQIDGTTVVGAGTYTAQAGSYTKIGNRVICNGVLTWTAHTGTGNMVIEGLPFTSVANTAWISIVAFSYTNLTFAGAIHGYVNSSATKITLLTSATGAAETALPMDTAGSIRFSVTYQAT